MREMDPVATACELIEGVLADRNAVGSVAAAQVQPASEVVILENTLDAALRQDLGQLSPEKRALLAARLRRQTQHDPSHDDKMTR
jgi:hypothetical protein